MEFAFPKKDNQNETLAPELQMFRSFSKDSQLHLPGGTSRGRGPTRSSPPLTPPSQCSGEKPSRTGLWNRVTSNFLSQNGICPKMAHGFGFPF